MTERDVSAARAAGGSHQTPGQQFEGETTDDMGPTSPIRQEDEDLMDYEDTPVGEDGGEEFGELQGESPAPEYVQGEQ